MWSLEGNKRRGKKILWHRHNNIKERLTRLLKEPEWNPARAGYWYAIVKVPYDAKFTAPIPTMCVSILSDVADVIKIHPLLTSLPSKLHISISFSMKWKHFCNFWLDIIDSAFQLQTQLTPSQKIQLKEPYFGVLLNVTASFHSQTVLILFISPPADKRCDVCGTSCTLIPLTHFTEMFNDCLPVRETSTSNTHWPTLLYHSAAALSQQQTVFSLVRD